jgi:hypothetical protein
MIVDIVSDLMGRILLDIVGWFLAGVLAEAIPSKEMLDARAVEAEWSMPSRD